MSLLSESQCRALFDMVATAARARGLRDVEAHIGSRVEALTRFANNTIHQNVSEEVSFLSIRPQSDGRTARASTNLLDRDGIERALDEAIALARASAPDPDLLPLASAAPITPVERFFESTALATPEDRARAVVEAIRDVEASGQTAAGIFSTESSIEAIYSTAGVDAYYTETMSRFSITAMAAGGSGWAKASSPDRGNIDATALARSAGNKARLSQQPRELPAGKYTVILEPAAVLDLVGQIFPDFSATSIADQRSFLTARLGEALFGENITIYDDAYDPLQAGPPFDGEGAPRKRLALIERGIPREIAYSRASAHKAGVAPTGHGLPLPNDVGELPVNIVIAGDETSLDEMIASAERAVLVTRLWYIREVDPYEKIMTGMTRDGTFLVEDGRLVCGIRNFRFNQSVVELLRNVEALSPAARASGEETFDMVVPAMRVRDFNFTEVTKF